jgi:hypothetical protein
VDAFAQVSQFVGGLCGFADQEGAGLAVGLSAPGTPPDVRIPPVGFATSNAEIATKVVGALAGGLRHETNAIGVVFPAVRGDARVDARALTQAEGHAVCVASRMNGGVGSVGLFRASGSNQWEEAHDQLDWLCERLRAVVNRGVAVESTEGVTFTVGG